MATYCFSDLHGQYDLWSQIKNFLKEDDIAYFLGDAIDRGPYGVQIMQEILKDKRITYLRGNHEEFIVDYMAEIIEGRSGSAFHWTASNGGSATAAALEMWSEDSIRYLCKQIKAMPDHLVIDNAKGQHLYLSHAGYEPWLTDEECRMMGRKDRYVWDRKHLRAKWWEPTYYNYQLHKMVTEEDTHDYANSFVIHGHTPVEYCPNPNRDLWINDDEPKKSFIPEVVFYCDGHKIDIDMGSFYTGRTAVLNLDTFEVTYFEAKPEGEFANA